MNLREAKSSALLRIELRQRGFYECRVEDSLNGFPDLMLHFPGYGSIAVETKAVSIRRDSWTAKQVSLRPKQKLFSNTWGGPYALLLWVEDSHWWYGLTVPKLVINETIFLAEKPLRSQVEAIDWLKEEARRQMHGRFA